MKEVRAIMITAIVLCSFISIGLANANDEEELPYQYNEEKTILTVTSGDKSLTVYRYYEGVKTAKETGKPILFALPSFGYSFYHHDEINKIVNNDFIHIQHLVTDITGQGDLEEYAYDIEYLIPFVMVYYGGFTNTKEIEPCCLLVLDSNGREITRIVPSPDGGDSVVQLDSDGNEIRSFDISASTSEESNNFILETLEYSKRKKGKIQMLPQEKGLISIKNLLKTGNHLNFFTVSGTIRDIEYTKNNRYNFNIDDGTGVISVDYGGGLGDIKEGDKVFVKGLVGAADGGMVSSTISKTHINTDTTNPDDDTSIPKTPALGAMFAITQLLAVAYLLRRR